MQQLYCAAYSMLHWYNIFAAEARLDLVFLGESNEKVTGVIVNTSHHRRLR
jgi:hypothetical protein